MYVTCRECHSISQHNARQCGTAHNVYRVASPLFTLLSTRVELLGLFSQELQLSRLQSALIKMAESGIESSSNAMLSDELIFGLDDELYELLGDVDSDGETSTYKRMLRMVIKERFWQMYRSLDFFLKRFIIDKSRLKGEHKDTAADVARISRITKEALELILHSHGAQTAAKFADLEGVKRFELVKCLMPGMLMPSVILRSENTVVVSILRVSMEGSCR